MAIWDTARGLMSRAVVAHLGEALVFSDGTQTATARGILTRPEQVVRLGMAHVTVGHAALAMRRVDAPAWIGRAVTVTAESGETFEITEFADNGETMLEIVLCRSS
jgi:hypothetical protein